MKRPFAFTLVLLLLLTLLAGCTGASSPSVQQSASDGSGAAADGTLDPNITATITFGTWNHDGYALYEALDIERRFQKLYPNVTVDIEQYKDDEEYHNALKIRASAGELPDLMFNLTNTIPQFQEYLVDLSDTEAAKNNELAAGYAVDGKIYGLPELFQDEYLLFWKDMFDEAGVEVPTTWWEFVDAADKLQTYFGAKDPDFSAITTGAKDAWPMYTIMENFPPALAGNGNIWNDMVDMDEPFAPGTPLYNAYTRAYDFFQAGYFGKDPLSLGHDQALTLFMQKKSAMMMNTAMGVTAIKATGIDTQNMQSIYTPFRDSVEDPYFAPVRGTFLLGVTNQSKNPELAKAFLEFYFSDAWYPDYINGLASGSTMSTVVKEKDPIMAWADTYTPDVQYLMYIAGGEDFTKLETETQLAVDKLGQQMLLPGYDLQAEFDRLNQSWTEARKALGYN